MIMLMIIQDINHDYIIDSELSDIVESVGIKETYKEQSIDSYITQQYVNQKEDLS